MGILMAYPHDDLARANVFEIHRQCELCIPISAHQPDSICIPKHSVLLGEPALE